MWNALPVLAVRGCGRLSHLLTAWKTAGKLECSKGSNDQIDRSPQRPQKDPSSDRLLAPIHPHRHAALDREALADLGRLQCSCLCAPTLLRSYDSVTIF